MVNSSIQIISLNPESSDCRRLLAELASQSLTAEIFPAIDGRQGTPELIADEEFDVQATLKYRLAALTGSEVGCYLSHLRAVRNAYEGGVEHLCLLEDDVRLEPNFSKVLKAAVALPEEVEFIRLMGLKIHRRKLLQDLIPEYNLTRPVKGLCGTQGYVINRAGMLKVLQYGRVINKPIDKLYDHFWDMDLRAYSIEPHLIWEEASGSSVAKKSSKPAKKILQQLNYFFDKKARSIKRYFYILAHRNEFSPASKPRQRPGKIRVKAKQ